MSPRGLLCAAVGVACIGCEAVVSADASVRPPARVLVYAQEWSLWLSRSSLPAGRAIVQLSNRGQDGHDLRIRRLERHGRMAGAEQGLATTQSGAVGQANWRLRPGRYELYCSMPGHLERGMHVKLLVR